MAPKRLFTKPSKTWTEEEPEQILFFYGPKSSGKTTLIYKYVERNLADDKKFSVKLFNLREVLNETTYLLY